VNRLISRAAILLLCGLTAAAVDAQPVGSAFTHQGRLTDAGNPANGAFDFRCILYDAPAGGLQVGPAVAVDDAAVSDGLFTIVLDFGSAAFAGSARWLEVAVRPGASAGAYTVVGGRQELRPAPNAVFSTSAPWTGVSGKPAGFADDVDDDSGGTVTSVATGAGLTGGPITTAGAVAVANGGIAAAMIANGAVGLAQIDTAQVQARVSGTCPLGSYLRGVSASGAVVCTPLPNAQSITVAESSASDVGQHNSIAIPPDGRPAVSFHDATNVVSYYDDTNGDLKVAKCASAACN
jgi:hypothetical protein